MKPPQWTFRVVLAVTAAAVGAVATAVVVHRTAQGTPMVWPSTVATPPNGDDAPDPVGQPAGAWRIVFGDEFDGPELDPSVWEDRSSAEADEGRGNPDNRQLEWNQADNCRVGDGVLVMTAKRESHTSDSGQRYDWTSCLISSAPSFTFQHGYIEERSILPAPNGFWPAFWTWQATSVDRQVETDVYEQYSAGARELQMAQHSGDRGGCRWKLPFDPAADWHTYAAAIEPSGTTWYVDGIQVCHTDATADGPTNIISNLAVYGERPPAGGTSGAEKRVDYIRAWARP